MTPPTQQPGATDSYELFTERRWTAVFVASPSNQPSVLPGIVTLGIGSGFGSLVWMATLRADTRGYLEVPVPNPGGLGTIVYWQVLTFDPNSLSVPFEVSNVSSVFYL